MKLSIVVPVYYNEDNLHPLYDDIKKKIIDVINYQYEIVFVNDGSKDRSLEVLKELSAKDNNIKVISLSRNFGSHAAILCGLSHSTGDCAVVKAADIQEPTELILDMVDSWKKGNNVVLAVRADRKEKFSQKLFANFYYSIVRKFALPSMPKNGFDVYLLDKKVVKTLTQFNEKNSALTGQILWSGYTTSLVPYVRQAREIGKSRWTLKKKIRLVMDTLFSFSTVPISAITAVGTVSCLGAVIWAAFILFAKISGKIPVQGYTTLLMFNLLSFGVIMLTLGILGEYLWRTFDASRNRPPFIIEEEININDKL